MQFLVYLTVLMVSVSTILLEVHWLTSPAPQQKAPAQAATAPAPPAKPDGPTTQLSPVYPKNKEANRSAGADAAKGSTSAAKVPATQGQASAKDQDAGQASQKADKTAGDSPEAGQAAHAESTATSNSCNIQACSAAYKSFRESDCTYQPYEGPRRVCTRSSAAASREHKEPAQSRRSTRDVERPSTRDVERRQAEWRPWRRDRDFDDFDDAPFFFSRGPRW